MRLPSESVMSRRLVRSWCGQSPIRSTRSTFIDAHLGTTSPWDAINESAKRVVAISRKTLASEVIGRTAKDSSCRLLKHTSTIPSCRVNRLSSISSANRCSGIQWSSSRWMSTTPPPKRRSSAPEARVQHEEPEGAPGDRAELGRA